VFPPPNMELDPRGKGVYALAPGMYTYPFDFKVCNAQPNYESP
jgi:hypothetical protein